jgi:hypothetical protein
MSADPIAGSAGTLFSVAPLCFPEPQRLGTSRMASIWAWDSLTAIGVSLCLNKTWVTREPSGSEPALTLTIESVLMITGRPLENGAQTLDF